jgi:hypothetical protein
MKKWVWGWAIGCVLMIMLGFGAGLWFAGERPVEIQTKVVEKVEWKDRVVEKIVEVEKKVEVKVEKVRWREVETKRPDGTVITERTEDKDVKTDTNTDTSKKTDTTKDSSGSASRTETTKTTYAKPQWAAGVDLGPNIPALFGGSHRQLVPGAPEWLDGGVSLERRILGPAWVGVRAGTAGSIQVRLRVEW